jgi:hypothetical protein
MRLDVSQHGGSKKKLPLLFKKLTPLEEILNLNHLHIHLEDFIP